MLELHYMNRVVKMQNKKSRMRGFTLLELTTVMVVIGILTTIITVSYIGIKRRTLDEGVESDVKKMVLLQSGYKYDHATAGFAYYSGTDTGNEFNYKPKSDNIIDAVTDDVDWCVRGYNVGSNYDSITNAYEQESNDGVCDTLGPSAAALAG